MSLAPTKSQDLLFRLGRYHAVIEITAIVVPLFAGLLMYALPQYFPWILYPELNLIAYGSIVVSQAICSLLYHATHRKVFFDISRYVFVIFFLYFIYETGGSQSAFIFLLIFPVLVSAVDLDPPMTRRMGIVVTLSLAAFIFFEPNHLYNPSFIVKHAIIVSVFGVLSYYVYKLVNETLRQKYEKDQADRRLTRMVEVEQLKNDFISVAQHQLRTPLSGVRYVLESLVGTTAVTADDRENIVSGLDRVKDAITIVNEILATAEKGENALTLTMAPVDIVSVVKDILKELSYVAQHKRTTVSLQSPPSLIANVDIKKVKPSLTNIIDNALKYSPHGKVTIDIVDEGKNWTMTVRDTGIGITPEDLPFVFNRLHRGANAIAVEPDESGVGLYTAKRIFDLHKGTVAVESVLEKGTTVTVRLPK